MTQRCFIAAIVPPPVKELAGRVIDDLAKMPQGNTLKLVRPEAVHITMHFLGDLTDEQVEEIQGMLTALTGHHHRSQLIADRVSSFPNERTPRVVFLNCQEQKETVLSSAQSSLKMALRQINVPVEERHWQPHVTLARATGPIKIDFSALRVSPLLFTVSEIQLMQSNLHPWGAEYKTIASFPLAR